jgi:uncharacterized protein (DUF1778 family)
VHDLPLATVCATQGVQMKKRSRSAYIRVQISTLRENLETIDAAARRAGLSRSAFLVTHALEKAAAMERDR